MLARVVETFEKIQAGQLCLDRTIDVVPSVGLDAERVRTRLPGHLSALRRLVNDQQWRPHAIIGLPVGFVGTRESKEALASIPHILKNRCG